jgi:putative SOS response-associated peptidase YedK
MIEEYFSSVSSEDDWNPRYNIAPNQPVPVIRQNPNQPGRKLLLAGLSRTDRYQTPHLLLRSPKRTLTHSIAAFGIKSIARLHPQ